ncbi:hypothetical protein [Frigoribacterium sp. MEB024]|uniref:hypothetical protein n=1 Tax=Frigoribacterium sp. MEB024 TaxID=1589899 RepID=UPI000B2B363F|nr:hypothetical protein [Frigoribacterium sp. MEB024]
MVTVVLPWRPQPSRVAAFEVVRDWYADALPEAEIRTIDSPDPVFNLAQCRNLGVAGLADDEVAVIGDADTLPQREPLLAAIEAARTSGRVHLPYTEYHWLGRDGTAQAAAGTPLERCDFELVRGACSGVYVTRASSWRSHGGQDERFRGWGFEDAAWYLAHTTLLGEAPRRHEGMVFALHHQAEVREGPQYDANAALMQRYRDAAVGADAMRAVVFGS